MSMEDIEKKKFRMEYLFHSSSADVLEHLKALRECRDEFWEVMRTKVNMNKLRGMAVVFDDEEAEFTDLRYAIFAVYEEEV